MLSKYDRQKIFYINLNGVVKDAAKKARSEYDDFMSFWTEEEKNVSYCCYQHFNILRDNVMFLKKFSFDVLKI